MQFNFVRRIGSVVWFVVVLSVQPTHAGDVWKRHTIDGSSRGADGVRLADVTGDGLLDLATGWEEGGLVRVYVNPGRSQCRSPWSAVTVGRVAAPEDAVLADLDGDGAVDVVSCCEGKTRTVFVHWAPNPSGNYLESREWRTEAIPATENKHLWMYALPMDVDGRAGIDLVVGSKSGALGWLRSPANPCDLTGWTYHPLYEAGWIMSLEARDMNQDGRLDVLVSDRKGKQRGVLWLEHPGQAAVAGPWREHRIADDLGEVMFLDTADLDGNGQLDIAVAVKSRSILLLLQGTARDSNSRWQSHRIDYPDLFGTAKAVRAADIDLDGKLDLVVTCEQAARALSGVFWLRGREGGDWEPIDIGGPEGVKFDRIELLDLDGDGDLDLITCEEQDNLGVIWYENPRRETTN
jgi:hypothetical protein